MPPEGVDRPRSRSAAVQRRIQVEFDVLSELRTHLPALESKVKSFVLFYERYRQCEGVRSFLDSWKQPAEEKHLWIELRGMLERLIQRPPDIPVGFEPEVAQDYADAMAKLRRATEVVRGVVRSMEGANLVGTHHEVYTVADEGLSVLSSVAERCRQETDDHMASMRECLNHIFIRVDRLDRQRESRRSVDNRTTPPGETREVEFNTGRAALDDETRSRRSTQWRL